MSFTVSSNTPPPAFSSSIMPVNERLLEERAAGSIRPLALAHMLYGGAAAFNRMQAVQAQMQADPVFATADRPFLNHTERYMRSAEKMAHFHSLMNKLQLSEQEYRWAYAAIDEVLPTDVHMAMVVPALEHQTSAEQRERWLPLAKSFQILGAYVQTELGHGSNVRALETTATFDGSSKEWIIHSPTLTSTKWWPGGLGKTATHAILMARVIIHGTDYGVSAFFIQIRDMGSHFPLPGITIGDIGPKLGFNSTDNGFMRFTHVRVPLDRMLMGVATVSETGEYKRVPGGDKRSYGAMLDVRANLVMKASTSLARAVTVAVRFSAVRLQGFAPLDTSSSNETAAAQQERPVLDYPTQQRGLFPLLAFAYALHFTGEHMAGQYSAYLKNHDESVLPALHATSAGLKALVTQGVADGIEAARKLCGGHGYSHASGLPDASANYLALATLEGTQQVLEPQTTRYLLRCLAAARKGASLPSDVAYLQAPRGTSPSKASHASRDLMDPTVQLGLFSQRARLCVLSAEQAVTANTNSSSSSSSNKSSKAAVAAEALVQGGVEIGRAARAHCQLHLLQRFSAAVSALEAQAAQQQTRGSSSSSSSSNSPHATLPVNSSEASVLRSLCSLFALSTIEANLGDFREGDTLSSSDAAAVRANCARLCAAIRPEAVRLVDAFHFSDALLCSAIGRYDGNVYPALMEWTAREPLNSSTVADSFDHVKLLVGTRPGARL